MFEELESRLYLLSEIEEYTLSIDVSENRSTVVSGDFSWKDLFQIFDDGEPMLSVHPHNITTSLQQWVKNNKMREWCSTAVEGILNRNWTERDIEDFEEKISEECTEQIREKLKTDSMKLIYNNTDEEVDMKKLSDNVSCSLKFKKNT